MDEKRQTLSNICGGLFWAKYDHDLGHSLQKSWDHQKVVGLQRGFICLTGTKVTGKNINPWWAPFHVLISHLCLFFRKCLSKPSAKFLIGLCVWVLRILYGWMQVHYQIYDSKEVSSILLVSFHFLDNALRSIKTITIELIIFLLLLIIIKNLLP